MKFELSRQCSKNYQLSNFTDLRPAEALLFHADRRKDWRTDKHEEGHLRFSQFYELAQETHQPKIVGLQVRFWCVLVPVRLLAYENTGSSFQAVKCLQHEASSPSVLEVKNARGYKVYFPYACMACC
jgi:hypothetical protein